MNKLMMKLKVFAAVVAGVVAFGAEAAIRVTSGVCAPADFVPLADNIIAGKTPTSQPKRGDEGAITPAPLTDGKIGKGANYSFCYNSGSFVYTLGDSEFGYDLKAVRFFGGWGGWRGEIPFDSLEYESVKNPGTWVKLSGGVSRSDGDCCYVMVDDDDGVVMAKHVSKVKINLIFSGGYHGLNEIEISAVESQEFDDYLLTNPLTGSTTFFNNQLPLGLSNLGVAAGADRWQLTEVNDSSALSADGWLDSTPTEQSFGAIATDRDVRGYVWFNSSSDPQFDVRSTRSQSLRYTTTVPTARGKDVETVTLTGRNAVLMAKSVNDGSTGGTSAGDGIETLDIPLFGFQLEIVSGPQGAADLDTMPDTLTVNQLGTYTVRFTAVNAAGNTDSVDITWSVSEVEGSEITWVGVLSGEYDYADNWYPTVIPIAGDVVKIAAGTAHDLELEAGVWPDRGEYASFVIEKGVKVICKADRSYVNEDAGGTKAIPLGKGVEIMCRNMTIAGTLSAASQGFGPGFNPDGADYGTAHGGAAKGSGIWKTGYGHITRPTELGGNWAGSGSGQTFGGGAVKLCVSGTLDVSGTVTADSTGRGSGGSIWIQANALTGAGKFTASSPSDRRQGAGGRIAIETVSNGFTGSYFVNAGAYNSDNPSYSGTIFIGHVPNVEFFGWGGTPAMRSTYSKEVLNSSIAAYSSSMVGTQALMLNRAVEQWKPGASYSWTEGFTLRNGGAGVANTATYVLSGLPVGRKAQITVNGEEIKDGGKSYRVADDGTLTFKAGLAVGAENAVKVSFLNGLAVIVR